MEKRGTRITLTVFTVMTITALLILGTWAWIEGTVNPGVISSNLQVSTSPGLVMKLDGAQTEVINLNEYCLNSQDQKLILMEASSGDGKTVYFRKPEDGLQAGTDPDHPERGIIYLRDEVDGDHNVNYLRVQFTLSAENADQKIWFDREKSFIKNDAGGPLKAVRVSLCTELLGENNAVTKEAVTFLCMRSKDELDEMYRNGTLRGVWDYDRSNHQLVDDEQAHNDNKIRVTDVKSIYDQFTKDDPWFILPQGQTMRVTMRVWLEGMDPECLDPIAGSSFQYHIFFDAAPDVS